MTPSAPGTQHSVLTAIAVDLGAESGRVVRGAWDGTRLITEEVHRFANLPVRTLNTLHWDALRLLHEIIVGLRRAGQTGSGEIASIGVDTWGVDFALLDREGALLANPVTYRDARTDAMIARAATYIPDNELYDATGTQFVAINTVYQLLALIEARSPLLEIADRFLMMPDLMHYWLCGVATGEYTNATTTGLLDARSRQWATGIATRLGIPTRLLPSLVAPGTMLGPLLTSVAEEAGIAAIPVIAPATHDTAAAVAAIPFTTAHAAYVSCGTWALVGVEVSEPIITAETRAANLTNEGGIGTIRLLRNVPGLWLVQECGREWERHGQRHTATEIVAAAAHAPAFGALVDPNAPAFASPGDMPAKIAAFCRANGQAPPEDIGAVARCIFESLALAWRATLAQIAAVIGHPFDALHVIGGGAQNALLCQCAANATGLPVIAGPVEATAMGNLLTQLIAHGAIASLAEGRAAIARSVETRTYLPHHTTESEWADAYARFITLRGAQRGV